MEKHPPNGHALATWGIDVTDDFTIAILKPVAIVVSGQPGGSFYDLPPMGLTVDVLRRLHAELGGLISYMEKGVSGPPRKN
jgi:hypothetical protein